MVCDLQIKSPDATIPLAWAKSQMTPLRFPLTLADVSGREICKSQKRMAPQVGLEPTTLRLTAPWDAEISNT